ncbi:cytoplasmic dynein 1 light intermediate chain 2-like isoform X2 [Ornithodoros turicata]|uniref:Dynein light intermediate chain n=1 Tax=Ornithodoros turicata TaxID=34597 RepID=A0A2R5LIP6_9ACAR
MAPFGEHSMADLQAEDKKEDEDEQNIWSSILKQVQASLPNKLTPHKLLLVLGDNESGKTTLIAKLQGNDDPKKGSGLEYHYLFVRDEYRDDHTRLGVWVLDGDPWHRNLLKYALNEETLEDTTVVLTGAMTQPWNLMESLNNWASVLEEHLARLKTPHALMERLRARALHRYQDYIEPGDEIEGVAAPLRRTSVSDDDPSSGAIPLGEDTMTHNLGLDVVVVITKTDYMGTLEKNYDFKDEHFDFIQQAVRKFCLRYGAALFYTSVKEDKNCDLLYKYLVHRIYGFPFKTPALVVEKDAVFVPSGWDNDKKIAILYENITSASPDDPYSEVITKPMIRKPLQREPEVSSEEDQVFLGKLQGLLNQQVPPPGRGQETPIRAPVGVQKSADRRLSGVHVAQGSPKKDTEFAKLSQVDGAKGAGGNEGVLQNFFNSLLNRKTGPGSAGGTTSIRTDKALVRSDAAAELERMTRSIGKNRTSPGPTSVPPPPSSIDDSTSGNSSAFST